MKVCVLGCGLRTPLLLHGLLHSQLSLSEIALYDCDPARAQLMARLGPELCEDRRVRVAALPVLEEAIADSGFVISSIRVGNMETRARDERIALECGFAGQETTGPAGFAMALRTIPVALEHARVMERLAPTAWLVNFTNPAGIITEAISTHTGVKVVGICDTPAELFFQIARALGEPPQRVQCEYFGLNHLGWVRAVRVAGRNGIDRLLQDDRLLRHLYPAELFPPDFIRALGLIPTEYLFFYYNQARARENQLSAGKTRGEELQILNRQVYGDLERYMDAGDSRGALNAYRRYLNRRNASYMRLEGAGESAFAGADPDWDPFEGATGYHRIAIEAIGALMSSEPHAMVLNVPNHGAIEGIGSENVVEVPCLVDISGPRPIAVGAPPEATRGLMTAVKHFERLTIEAATTEDWARAALALAINPIVGSWDAARLLVQRMAASDEGSFHRFHGLQIL